MSYDSNPLSPVSTEPTLSAGDEHLTGEKRKTPPTANSNKPEKKAKKVGSRLDSKADLMTNGEGDKDGDGSASKPKRVRTGCLTCRVCY